jgi:hypothetical protein
MKILTRFFSKDIFSTKKLPGDEQPKSYFCTFPSRSRSRFFRRLQYDQWNIIHRWVHRHHPCVTTYRYHLCKCRKNKFIKLPIKASNIPDIQTLQALWLVDCKNAKCASNHFISFISFHWTVISLSGILL